MNKINSEWISDEYGSQGDIYFDGYNYWLIAINKCTGAISSIAMTAKEFNERNLRLREKRKSEKL